MMFFRWYHTIMHQCSCQKPAYYNACDKWHCQCMCIWTEFVRLNKSNKLWRFFQRPVAVELWQHGLHSRQRVWKIAIVQSLDGFLDPLEKIWHQSLVVGNHLIILTTQVNHLFTDRKQSQHETDIVNTGSHCETRSLLDILIVAVT